MAHFTIGSLQKRGTPDYKKRNVTGPGVSLLGLGCLPSEAGISASPIYRKVHYACISLV